ncbi:hypothetical protein I4U23_026845 [Adineta vaga]|nr:hypothetical protein I4U23_026845 [Adineta vaga]
MNSSLVATIIFLFIQSVVGAHVQDNRIIIGSSVGGVLGLIILILDLIAIFELLKSSGRGVFDFGLNRRVVRREDDFGGGIGDGGGECKI